MTAFDLTDEYIAAVDAITDADIECLEDLGIPPEIASGLLPDYPVLGKARIETFDSDWSYQPVPDGDMHYLCPCANGLCIEDVDVIDLAAWRPSTGGKIWLRTGLGTVLNPSAQMTAYHAAEPLYIFSDVLNWLRGRCKGVVVLRWDKGLPFHLGTTVPLWCQTTAMASDMDKIFELDRPEILYSERVDP